MKATELKNKTAGELKEMSASLKKELFNLRFQTVTGEMTNTSRFREVRRDIARIKTALTVANKNAA